MIIVKVEIICDVCGKIFNTAAEMDYRTSAAAPAAVMIARSHNWQFTRDANYKLERTYCPECAVSVTFYKGD